MYNEDANIPYINIEEKVKTVLLEVEILNRESVCVRFWKYQHLMSILS